MRVLVIYFVDPHVQRAHSQEKNRIFMLKLREARGRLSGERLRRSRRKKNRWDPAGMFLPTHELQTGSRSLSIFKTNSLSRSPFIIAIAV